jgi:hypothetical protein
MALAESMTVTMTARQISSDIKTLQRIISHRVNTWSILGCANHVDPYLHNYHATSGEHSVGHLSQSADNLLLKDWSHLQGGENTSWVGSIRLPCMPISRQPNHMSRINLNVAMHQQVLAFHFKLAELLEDLSQETLENLQQQHRMRDVAARLQTDLVQRSRALAGALFSVD